MKYLKLFEELNDRTLLEKVSDINDIIGSLSDIGFNVEITIKLFGNDEVEYDKLLDYYTQAELDTLNQTIDRSSIDRISLKIHKNDKSKFLIEGDDPIAVEIKDSLIRIKSILSDWDFDMTVKWKNKEGRLISQYGVDIKDDTFIYELPPFSPYEINWAINLIRVDLKS